MNSTDAQALMNSHLRVDTPPNTAGSTQQSGEMSMEEDEHDDYSDYSEDDENEDEYSDRVGTPGSWDAELGTRVQSDGIRRVKHESIGWRVTLPVMVETKYCGCYSWLVGIILFPCFGGCICCCPIDKKMKPKQYDDRTCCDSFWDFCMPSRRREMNHALEYRREKKWVRSEEVTEKEKEMDLDQKIADDRREATDLVLSVLTKHAMVPQEALDCCHGPPGMRNHRRPVSGISRRSGNSWKSQKSQKSTAIRPESGGDGNGGGGRSEEEDQEWYEDGGDDDGSDEAAVEDYYDDHHYANDEYDQEYCQYIWCQVKLERLSLSELRECVLRHHLMVEMEEKKLPSSALQLIDQNPQNDRNGNIDYYDYPKEDRESDSGSGSGDRNDWRTNQEDEEEKRRLEEERQNMWTRNELEMVIDRWRHAPEREEKRQEVLERRKQDKYLREAPSVWVFGANNEGQLGQLMSSSAQRNPLEVPLEKVIVVKKGEEMTRTKEVPVVEYVDGCLFPRRLDALHNCGVLEVYSGFSCSMASAITEDGDLYLWGNGDDVHSMLAGPSMPKNSKLMSPPGTASTGRGSHGSAGSSRGKAHPLLKVKFQSDADRFAYQMDRDTIRDEALAKFANTVGEYREHQIHANGLKSLVDKYFCWLNQIPPDGTATDEDHFVVEKPTLYDFKPFLRLMGKWGSDIWKNDYAGEWEDNHVGSDGRPITTKEGGSSTKSTLLISSPGGIRGAPSIMGSPENVFHEIILGVSDTGKLPPYPPTIVDVLRGEEITSVSICRSPRSIHCVCVTVDGGDTFVGEFIFLSFFSDLFSIPLPPP